MKVHLVSYATPKYRHRQMLLAASARANGVVETTTSWTLSKLQRSEFSKLAPDISLSERGSGFWAWKPFIILEALEALPDGEIVFYCDVGRKFPYILLEQPMDRFAKWMVEQSQDIMPGVLIPWNGPMSQWTKRDTFVATEMDKPEFHAASPIQASFSFWRVGPRSRTFLKEWLSWCVQRQLVSDDPGTCGQPELPGFQGHRHDQSLMTLCCLKHGIRGMDLGLEMPNYNERNPGEVLQRYFAQAPSPTTSGKALRIPVSFFQWLEQTLRSRLSFGKKYE